jgi:hypothetical protein
VTEKDVKTAKVVASRLASLPREVEEKLMAAGPDMGRVYREFVDAEERAVKAREAASRGTGMEDMPPEFQTTWESAPPSVKANLLALKHRMEQDKGDDATFARVLERCEALHAQWVAAGQPETPIPS